MSEPLFKQWWQNLSIRSGLIVLAGWTVVIGASYLWNYQQEQQRAIELARTEARTIFDIDLLFRRWATSHGGVYVPVTEATPPNPYLLIPERDITTPSGVQLTKMNPAYMIRQLHELGWGDIGIYGHITSLKPLRPENKPDAWEAQALRAFESGVGEVSALAQFNGSEHLRLMRPMRTEAGCLTCHARQGYVEGDIRGGISVSVPMQPYWQIVRTGAIDFLWVHGGLWLIGSIMIAVGVQKFEQLQQESYAEVLIRDQAIETSASAMAMADSTFHLTYVNRAALTLWGYTDKAEVVGHALTDFLTPLNNPAQQLKELVARGSAQGYYQGVRRNGTKFEAEIFASTVKDRRHRVYLLASITDITERAYAEASIKAALLEKETLLRELYHRTKNNMMVIIALLDLQAAEVHDERLELVLGEIKNRIYSMSLVHQKLYDTQDLSHINLQDYLTDLTHFLVASYQAKQNQITLALELAEVLVPIDVAIPVGLIANELITNTLKYAFPHSHAGELFISLTRNATGEITLIVRDNGVGIPASFNFQQDGHMGLQTVFALGETQLHGQVNFVSQNGLTCTVRFYDTPYKKRVGAAT